MFVGFLEGFGMVFVEELFQKNKGKFKDEGELINIIEGIGEVVLVFRIGQRDFDDVSLFFKLLLDEKVIQWITMYYNNDFDSDIGYLVLI